MIDQLKANPELLTVIAGIIGETKKVSANLN